MPCRVESSARSMRQPPRGRWSRGAGKCQPRVRWREMLFAGVLRGRYWPDWVAIGYSQDPAVNATEFPMQRRAVRKWLPRLEMEGPVEVRCGCRSRREYRRGKQADVRNNFNRTTTKDRVRKTTKRPSPSRALSQLINIQVPVPFIYHRARRSPRCHAAILLHRV